ncbi:MAG TPA: hypothetical protein DCF68_09520 [Cyanothece sp. UBA12306]|nr:hypothetical protein [Cyanothece sp. UBA12306]
MNKTSKILVSIALFLFGWGAFTTSHSVQAARDPFADFLKTDCVPGAEQAGLRKNEAQKGCTCAMNSLKKKYSTTEFEGLLTSHRNGDDKATSTLRSYSETCFDKVLEEIMFE